MSTLQTLSNGISLLAFRTALNSNFTALNNDKAERSVLQYASKGLFNGTETKTISGIQTDVSMKPSAGIGSNVLPGWYFDQVGKAVRFRIAGYYSTDNSAGTAQIKCVLGSTTVASGAVGTLPNNVVNGAFCLEGMMTCRSTGSTGTVSLFSHSLTQQTDGTVVMYPIFSISDVTVDLTQPLAFDFLTSQSDAGTVLNVSKYTVWSEFDSI